MVRFTRRLLSPSLCGGPSKVGSVLGVLHLAGKALVRYRLLMGAMSTFFLDLDLVTQRVHDRQTHTP